MEPLVAFTIIVVTLIIGFVVSICAAAYSEANNSELNNDWEN